MSLASGHQVELLEGEELAQQQKDWTGYTDGLIRLTPGRWLFPTAFSKYADKYYSFQFRESDVVLVTYPKCGTTWTQEIIWTMRNNPDLGHHLEDAPVMLRSPFLDADMLLDASVTPELLENDPMLPMFETMFPGKDPADGMMLQVSEAAPEPRTLKSHLPFSLLPPSLLHTNKVVYVARNPKDVIFSYLHHCRLMNVHGYVGSLEQFVEYFMNDDCVYGPYWLHLSEAWEKRHHPNLHFIFYEDLQADVMVEIRKLNTFLGTNLTEDQLRVIARHGSFGEMKSRSAMFGTSEEKSTLVNVEVVRRDGGFFRKGVTGDWKGKLSPELDARLDKWITDRITSLGITFTYSAVSSKTPDKLVSKI